MRTKGKFMTKKKIVIIGSSIAGLSAAEAARAQDPACDIIILSEDSFLPYYRQRLCEALELMVNTPARNADEEAHKEAAIADLLQRNTAAVAPAR